MLWFIVTGLVGVGVGYVGWKVQRSGVEVGTVGRLGYLYVMSRLKGPDMDRALGVSKKRRGEYEVSYMLGGREYKIDVRKKSGPSWVRSIENGRGEDVTSKVMPYMGPNYDWHKNVYMTEDFGEEELMFELSNGERIRERGAIMLTRGDYEIKRLNEMNEKNKL